MRDLNDMAVFAGVVEAAGISSAARRLGLPKSNVSRRLARLEERLNVRLLERTTRRVHLTEIGEVYYRHCRRILEEADHADLCVDHLAAAPRGLLRVSASVTTGHHLLGSVLGQFICDFPEIRVQLVLSNSRVDLIEEGFDVAIRVGELDDTSLIAKRLGESRLVFYASPEYVAAHTAPETPDDLHAHQLLIMSDKDVSHRLELIGPTKTKSLTVKPWTVINDFEVLRRAVMDGCGISIIPEYMCLEDEETERLVRVLADWSLPPVEFHALFPSHRGATPKVRAFLDFLANRVSRGLLRA